MAQWSASRSGAGRYIRPQPARSGSRWFLWGWARVVFSPWSGSVLGFASPRASRLGRPVPPPGLPMRLSHRRGPSIGWSQGGLSISRDIRAADHCAESNGPEGVRGHDHRHRPGRGRFRRALVQRHPAAMQFDDDLPQSPGQLGVRLIGKLDHRIRTADAVKQPLDPSINGARSSGEASLSPPVAVLHFVNGVGAVLNAKRNARQP